MSSDRMLRPTLAVLLWCGLSLVAALYGIRAGLGTRAYFALLVAFMMLMAGEIWLAAPAISRTLERISAAETGALMALWPLGAYFVYAIGTGTFGWWRAGIAAAFTLAPVALVASASGHKPGAWQDYAAMLVIALPIKLGWLRVIFPFPGGRLVYVLTVLMAVNTALAAFVFVRGLDGIGYSAGWARGWGWAFGISLATIAAIDIPLGIRLDFIRFEPRHGDWRFMALNVIGIFLFTAVPEELLFRGVLQNVLGKALSRDGAGWIVASIIFGFSHIANGRFPNWKYVLLATIAGFFYGYAWRKSRSIFPGALVHTAVDGLWFLLFRTL
jgi:membrane protease YdiL (CAAX protease family)